MDIYNGIGRRITGSSETEAWADVKKVDKDTKVSTPSYEAVEAAKAWVEENEK